MTQDDVIEMAREACLFYMDYIRVDSMKQLEDFANLVAAKAFQSGYEKGIAGFNEAVSLEREACAKLVKDYMKETAIMEARGCLASVAYDIRARGEQA